MDFDLDEIIKRPIGFLFGAETINIMTCSIHDDSAFYFVWAFF